MEKPAETRTPIHPLLAARWSPRAYADTPVPQEILLSLLEAARWSASAFNEQPWRFIIATKAQPEAFAKALSCLSESNQRWAGSAPVLMFTFAALTHAVNGSPIRTALYDVGLAVQNMVVQASAHQLAVRQMAGIDLDKVRQVYAVPENFVPITGLALGYRGEPDMLDEKLREREMQPRTRKPLNELVFDGEWGISAVLVQPNGE